MGDLFVQEHMPMMWMFASVPGHIVDCIGSIWAFIYRYRCLIFAHELTCGLYVAFEGLVIFLYVHGNSMFPVT